MSFGVDFNMSMVANEEDDLIKAGVNVKATNGFSFSTELESDSEEGLLRDFTYQIVKAASDFRLKQAEEERERLEQERVEEERKALEAKATLYEETEDLISCASLADDYLEDKIDNLTKIMDEMVYSNNLMLERIYSLEKEFDKMKNSKNENVFSKIFF